MNTIKRDSTRLHSVLWFGLPLSFGFALVLTTVLIAPILVWITAARIVPSPSDPFSAYTSIMPGQPRDAVINLGITCSLEVPIQRNVRSNHTQYCLNILETGVFTRISVYISLDNLLVEQVFFNIRHNALILGDLILLWGNPSVYRYKDFGYRLYWDDRAVWAQTEPSVEAFSVFLPVERVVFTSEPL